MAIRKSKKYDASDGSALQFGMFGPVSDWRPTPVSELPSWKGAKRIALDLETKDPLLHELGPGPRRPGGYPIGIAFAIDGGPKHYLPYRHEGGDNLPVDEVLSYARENAAEFKGEVVGANLSYDLDWCGYDGIEFNDEATFCDIQVADPIIYELHQSFSLKNIGERWGIQAKDETLLEQAAKHYGVHSKKGMWRLPARFVGIYAEGDVASPLKIFEEQEKIIKARDLEGIWRLECNVLPVLVRMRQRGVLIDQDKLAQVSSWALREEMEELAKVKRDTGHDIGFGNVWKPDAIAPALESIGVSLKKTSTGAPNIDANLLEGLDHPVGRFIRRARKLNKIRTTFVASIDRYMVNGRIHCTLNQVAREDEKGDQKGVRYGRLSAVDPNLQQQPNPERDPDVAGEWRKIYVPEPGSIWGCCDYSQQEPRWTTHFAAVMGLPRAAEAAERYRNDPNADNHEMMTKLVHGDEQVRHWMETDPKGIYKTRRAQCKNIFLGLCYGEGGAKLCRDIGMPTRWALTLGFGRNREVIYFGTKREAYEAKMDAGRGSFREVAGEEGQAILDGFDEAVPYVRQLARAASDRAESVGYVRTIMGRRLHFSARDDGTYDWTHKALNRVIQGSSADQMKLALVELDREGHFIQLQVHDEANGSYESVEEVRRVAEIMRDCIKDYSEPLVPFKVDAEYGPSWGDLKAA